ASDAFRAGHRRALDPAGELLAAAVRGRERQRLVAVATRQAGLDWPRQLSQRQTDIEGEHRLTDRFARADTPHVFGAAIPELDASLLQFGVDRLQFGVG